MILQKIKILDPHCVNQIAAGEVVERPLSVVKELVENALDAAAGKIEISVESGGTPLIRVKDDGTGIDPAELELAILPHATSKIAAIEDLNSLQTLGFRGEALPSIASVSRLTLQSRTPSEVSGVEIQVMGGEITARSATGCPVGTTVTVRDLFFNTPARHKFLRSNSTEFGYISDMVSRLALARPDVSFTLRHPQNLILHTPGRGDLLETIATVLGNETARKLLPLSFTEGNLKISGFLSPPELVRSSATALSFLINGRVIRSQLLNQALKEGYHTLIPAGTYPVAVVSLQMNPAEYDVNVHPAKLEVKFNRENELKATLADVVRNTLLTVKPVKSLFTPAKQIDSSGSVRTSNQQQMTKTAGSSPNPTEKNPAPSAADNLQPSSWPEQMKIIYKPQLKPEHNTETNYAELSLIREDNSGGQDDLGVLDQDFRKEPRDDPESPSLFEELRPLAQLFATYLLCTDEKSLYIIDQHAAHERIQYEELLRLLSDQTISSQILLIPETIDLTAQEEQVLLHHLPELQEMGFVVEHFGERTYFLRGVPLLGNLSNPGRLFRQFLDEIITQANLPSRQKFFEEWIFLLACRSAIKGHENLTLPEMEELIQKLGRTANPLSCPHGRPIIIEVSRKELEKRFSRG